MADIINLDTEREFRNFKTFVTVGLGMTLTPYQEAHVREILRNGAVMTPADDRKLRV